MSSSTTRWSVLITVRYPHDTPDEMYVKNLSAHQVALHATAYRLSLINGISSQLPFIDEILHVTPECDYSGSFTTTDGRTITVEIYPDDDSLI